MFRFPLSCGRCVVKIVEPRSIFLNFLSCMVRGFVLVGVGMSLFVELCVGASTKNVMVRGRVGSVVWVVLHRFVFRVLERVVFSGLCHFLVVLVFRWRVIFRSRDHVCWEIGVLFVAMGLLFFLPTRL